MNYVEIHCKECSALLATLELLGDDSAPVLEGLGIKCPGCKKVIRFYGYTEGIIKKYVKHRTFKGVKSDWFFVS